MKTNLSDKTRRLDRLAEWFIKTGGILVILSVVGILVMIARVALPLFSPPHVDIVSTSTLPPALKTATIVASGCDETGKRVFLLDGNGTFHIVDPGNGRETQTLGAPRVPPGATSVRSAEALGKSGYNLVWNNGAVSSVSIAFASGEAGDHNAITATLTPNEDLSFDGQGETVRTFVRGIEKGALRIDQLPSGRFSLRYRLTEKDIQGNSSAKTVTAEFSDRLPGTISSVTLDHKGHYLYAGTDNGWLVRWDVSEPGSSRLLDTVVATEGVAITALNLALGDVSLVVGDAAGGYSVWFPVTSAGSGEDKRLTRIHQLPGHGAAVTMIAPSYRNKSLLSLDKTGVARLDHTTTERTLVTIPGRGAPVIRASLSPRGTALTTIDANGTVAVWNISAPHPEVTLATLFGKVWYEGYDKPEYVWQSSSASDDFEPKMSLTPLLFGTIKATAFAMLFAIPLALCGALYTSQFMAPQLKSRIKPAVEIMAAIPSVVVGFLAGLWLAPMIDKSLLSLFLILLIAPLFVFIFLLLWKRIPTASRLEHLSRGREFIILIPVVLAAFFCAHLLAAPLEAALFAGDFKQWLFGALGMRYDQRNSIIIAIALGFAVVPIIFTIAEDAISNVPRNLTAASLALGASRWQTAWRVVLPSAMPGVFSAVMIGFGRAIGETMIVLMATGNTPIMSWSIFNGLRSLSANIAVEIPEAPLDGSLYRVLFLSAVLLFIFTFLINTFAEALRQRFRKKYGRY